MTWLLWLGSSLFVLAALQVSLAASGNRQWRLAIQALQHRLETCRVDDLSERSSPTHRYDARELQGLPAPVQRYFRSVLTDGQPIITAVTIHVAGSFNMSAVADRWKPFTSRQRAITRRPGFLWDARISMLPGVAARVVDSYIGGKGLLHATVQGLFTMAKVCGEGEIARGEFMRYFAEAPWYPTALLPSQGVRWEAVDDHSAHATMTDEPISLTLLFRFNEDGLIGSFRAEARGSMVGKDFVMAPWEGNWSDYAMRDGVRVPLKGEVAWMRSDGRKPYFVGTVSSLTFEFSP